MTLVNSTNYDKKQIARMLRDIHPETATDDLTYLLLCLKGIEEEYVEQKIRIMCMCNQLYRYLKSRR